MSFNNFQLCEPILRALHEKGYSQPTPIQQKAIPQIIHGKDVIGSAETGTGKTAAFCIPILQRLRKRSHIKGIKALIVTPTRELATQVEDNLRMYGKHLHLRNAKVFGGVSQRAQVQQFRKGVDILVATPGRLLDLMNQGIVRLDALEILVLDEADRMLDMGFIHDIRKIIAACPPKRQNLFFSATMPKEVMKLTKSFMNNPIHVDVQNKKGNQIDISHYIYHVNKNRKRALLKHVIEENEMSNVLVFSRTKHGANRITKDLNKSGISAEAIHGNKSQNAREKALSNFKSNATRVLVATDIAARGIDIKSLPFVINFELPESAETYTHRIGRTGRAGETGSALSFCDVTEKPYLNNINRRTSHKLASIDHPFV